MDVADFPEEQIIFKLFRGILSLSVLNSFQEIATEKKLGDAIAISNLKLSITDPLTDRDRC